MINQLFLYFIATALLFFFLSLLARPKLWYIVVPLNIIFLGVLLFSYTQIIGNPIPFQYDNIPFWKTQTLEHDTKVVIDTYYVEDKLIHMIVYFGDKTRYVTVANTPDFLAKLLEAQGNADKAGKKKIAMMIIQTDQWYDMRALSTFPDQKTFQKNNNITKSDFVGGVEQDKIEGEGQITNPTANNGVQYNGGAGGINPETPSP